MNFKKSYLKCLLAIQIPLGYKCGLNVSSPGCHPTVPGSISAIPKTGSSLTYVEEEAKEIMTKTSATDVVIMLKGGDSDEDTNTAVKAGFTWLTATK